eukprot:4201365-Pleurochrysis_carterae.AAC.2
MRNWFYINEITKARGQRTYVLPVQQRAVYSLQKPCPKTLAIARRLMTAPKRLLKLDYLSFQPAVAFNISLLGTQADL